MDLEGKVCSFYSVLSLLLLAYLVELEEVLFPSQASLELLVEFQSSFQEQDQSLKEKEKTINDIRKSQVKAEN